MLRIKAETVLAERNRMRGDLDHDPHDPEWFALHRAFCFISHRSGELRRCLDEKVAEGEQHEG
jgi:hypothetical protein